MKNKLKYALVVLLLSSGIMAFCIFLALYCIITGLNTELAYKAFVGFSGITLICLILSVIILKR